VKYNASSVSLGIEILSTLRQVASEDINQIQHEEMTLRAALLLQETIFPGQRVAWYWNPRQTGDRSEPDLRAALTGEIVLSAEVTTSERPVRAIDKRMTHTLAKLGRMPGRKFFFVRSEAMEQRARAKIEKGRFGIEVRRI